MQNLHSFLNKINLIVSVFSSAQIHKHTVISQLAN